MRLVQVVGVSLAQGRDPGPADRVGRDLASVLSKVHDGVGPLGNYSLKL